MTALAVAVVVCVGMLARTIRHDHQARDRDVVSRVRDSESVRATKAAISAYEAADDLLLDALAIVGEWSAP